MSVAFGSSSFVSDGLVLYLDASNPKNYILTEAEVLVIGGGGGGSENQYDDGSGGGGGGFIQRIIQTLSSTAYTITVGTGGGAGGSGSVGGNTSAFGLIAYGGGGGSSHRSGGGGAVDGASGGGSGGQYSADTPVVGRAIYGPEQGNDGGYSISYGGGGGGGAGGAGQGSITYGQGGHGGRGRSSSISGTLKYYSAGGGGWGYAAEGMGGLGGGGNSGTSPVQNTGSGGGGGKTTSNRANSGAAGVVIIRYPGPQKATGGNTITQVSGYTIHTFTSTGTFTTLAVPANSGAINGLQDLSGNNNTGTQSGGVTYSSANGGSLSFDGSNDWFSTTLSIGDANTSFSWGGFVKVNSSTSSNFFLFGNYTENSTTPFFAIAFNNSGDNTFIYIRDSTGGTEINSGNTNLDLSTWYYLIGVRDAGANQVKLYVNGELVDTDTFAGSHNVKSTTNNFGGVRHLSSYANCNIGNVHVYNRALTATEVSQNFNALRGRFGL